MANFFTDEIFTCSCGSMLFEDKITKSFKVNKKQLFDYTITKHLVCKSCGREIPVNDEDQILEQA